VLSDQAAMMPNGSTDLVRSHNRAQIQANSEPLFRAFPSSFVLQVEGDQVFAPELVHELSARKVKIGRLRRQTVLSRRSHHERVPCKLTRTPELQQVPRTSQGRGQYTAKQLDQPASPPAVFHHVL